MSELSKEQFENVLLDVRKAYRLLFLYQQRILTLMQHIGDSLDFRTFGGGYNWHSYNQPPHGNKAKLSNTAWDWLSMYFYEFNFSEKTIKNNLFRFSILLESDTGYYDTLISSENINSYAPIEKATTKLIFLLGKNVWWDPDYKDVFEDENLDIYKSSTSNLIRSNEKGVLIAKSFLLSEFINNDQTNKCLVDWVELLNNNSINEIVLS